jgi:DtxR family transcriptional regulator, Mn-dependent transcriptional regulator
MTAENSLTASLEDYLEAIFHIETEKQAARPKDIAQRLKVKNASVTGALRSLAEKGMIHYAPYDLVTLTPDGRVAAEGVVNKHETLRSIFINLLSVDEKTADAAACKMEHCISDDILNRFIDFAKFVETCPRGGVKWVAGFGYHCDQDASPEVCERCMERSLGDFRQHNQCKIQDKPMSATTSLKALKKGQRGKVVKIDASSETNKRIVEMGVTPGTIIEVDRVAPLGDPIDIRVKGYHLTLRKTEAEGIEVEPVA